MRPRAAGGGGAVTSRGAGAGGRAASARELAVEGIVEVVAAEAAELRLLLLVPG